jgi:hypothetical protein
MLSNKKMSVVFVCMFICATFLFQASQTVVQAECRVSPDPWFVEHVSFDVSRLPDGVELVVVDGQALSEADMYKPLTHDRDPAAAIAVRNRSGSTVFIVSDRECQTKPFEDVCAECWNLRINARVEGKSTFLSPDHKEYPVDALGEQMHRAFDGKFMVAPNEYFDPPNRCVELAIPDQSNPLIAWGNSNHYSPVVDKTTLWLSLETLDKVIQRTYGEAFAISSPAKDGRPEGVVVPDDRESTIWIKKDDVLFPLVVKVTYRLNNAYDPLAQQKSESRCRNYSGTDSF